MSDFTQFIINNRVKKGTWHKKENHNLYANYLATKLDYKNIDDWYKINSILINKNYGSGLIKFYKGSPIMFLKEVFPQHKWLEWKFTQTTQGFWNKLENHILYVNYLSETLNYTKKEDFYNLTNQIISDNYGGGLLMKYNGSPFLFLKKIFPEYNWLGWKFQTTPYHFWNSETEKQYVNWLGEKCGYKNIDDWYKISRKILIDNHGGGYILKKYKGSPSLFIKTMFPEKKWEKYKFSKNYSNGQIQWLEFIKISTPDIQHIKNSSDGEFKIPNSKYLADGYSYTQNCIYEYHGDFWHGNPSLYEPDHINKCINISFGNLYNNTIKKQQFCEKNGYKFKFIWESDWLNGIKSLIKIQKKYKIFSQKLNNI
jgi:hypothetical protein